MKVADRMLRDFTPSAVDRHAVEMVLSHGIRPGDFQEFDSGAGRTDGSLERLIESLNGRLRFLRRAHNADRLIRVGFTCGGSF